MISQPAAAAALETAAATVVVVEEEEKGKEVIAVWVIPSVPSSYITARKLPRVITPVLLETSLTAVHY